MLKINYFKRLFFFLSSFLCGGVIRNIGGREREKKIEKEKERKKKFLDLRADFNS